MTDKHDFKAALVVMNTFEGLYNEHDPLDQDIARNLETILTALRLADRLQSGELKYEILEQAIDEMGWDEINAFNEQEGQSIYEDAGGYLLRKIKCLFGIYPKQEIETYQEAARRLVNEAKSNVSTND